MRPRSQKPNGRGHTAAQSIAAQENFAIYLLRGMASAMYHVQKVPCVSRAAGLIRKECLGMVEDIRQEQAERKQTQRKSK